MNFVTTESSVSISSNSALFYGDSSAPLRMVVVCRSKKTASHWHSQAKLLSGLEIITELGCQSYYRLINDIIAQNHEQPVLLVHDDIQCGLGFAEAVQKLLNELECDFSCWGICGNAGISWDGRETFRYIKDPHGGPQYGLSPEFALGIDGNVMLLNVPALAAVNVTMPQLNGFHGYDIVLSLECLRKGLPVLCDRRLFVMHKSGGDNEAFQAFIRSELFQGYLTSHFLNHSLPTVNGFVDTSSMQSYHYLDIPTENTLQDVVDLFDKTLVSGRSRRPSLTIGCRSQFNRADLLTRAVASFAVTAQQVIDLIEIKVFIVSDQPGDVMAAEMERLRSLFPGLDLSQCPFTARPQRYSRTEALLTAINNVETDYIWFVDDDDFVFPDAVCKVARVLQPDIPRLVVGHSMRIQETWVDNGNGGRLLMESRQVGRNVAEGVFHAFSGDNHTPICSIIFPVTILRERLVGLTARGDYYEDYFLLLLALSAKVVEVRLIQEDFCGISLRAGENTVTEPCRDHWDLSYVTFVSEVLCHPNVSNPILWQIAELRGSNVASSMEIIQSSGSRWSRFKLKKLSEIKEIFRLIQQFCRYQQKNGFKAAVRKVQRYIFDSVESI